MKYIILIVALYMALNIAGLVQAVAQNPIDNDRVEMADRFRQEGKIFVVVAIIGVVLGGMLIYTIRIDQRIKRLEDELRGDGRSEAEKGI